MKVSSPVGEYEYRVDRVAFRNRRVEVLGRLGQWETTTVLEPSDLRKLLRRSALPLMFAGGLWAVTRRRGRV